MKPKHLSTDTDDDITKAERADLLKVTRLRAKVAKANAVAYSSKLRADIEEQLSAIFSFDQDETWKAAAAAAEQAVEKARADVAARCMELGIPKRFAPDLAFHWYGRGENASASRRAELRKLGYARIDALIESAKAQIDKVSSEVQTQLLATGLTSEAAKAFLESMPSVESLMPHVDIKALHPGQPQ